MADKDIGLVQQIKNGQAVGNTTSADSAKAKNAAKETKDMFLQLLVAEMKYQDPMEPTDNSEYVKELATFTQVESMQSVQNDVNAISANALTGKFVVMNAENGGVEGYVDFVKHDAAGIKISINGKLYDASGVESVLDETYYGAVMTKDAIAKLVKNLPKLDEMKADDETIKKIATLEQLYASLGDYQKTLVSADDQATIDKYIKRMTELVKAKEATQSTTGA